MSSERIAGASSVGSSPEGGREDPALRLDPARDRHWLHRIRPLLRRQAGLSLLVTLFAIGAIVFQTAIPSLLGKSIDALDTALRVGDAAPLRQALLLLLAGGLARSAMNFSVRYTLFMLSYRVESSLRQLVYRKLTALPLPFLARFRTGQILSRAGSDVRTIQNFLLYLPYTLMAFGAFFLSIGYMFAIDVRLALLAIAPLPVVFLLSMRLRRLAYPLSWLVQSRMADVASVVDENIRGHSVVKLFGRERQQIESLKAAATRLRWASLTMIGYRARYSPWIENIAVLGQIAILVYGGHLVINGELRLGQLVAFNVYVLMLLTPFGIIGQVLVMARNASAAAHRVFALIDEDDGLDAPQAKRESPGRIREIVLEGVRYTAPEDPEYPDSGGRLVLDGVDASLRAGRITAIVGKTGSGKTALAHLIAGIAQPEAGQILRNGKDLARIDSAGARRELILVPQDSFLFADSIANNIAFGVPDADHAEIVRAALIAPCPADSASASLSRRPC
jgi:ATP-binding cassette subfamily B protein